MSKKTNGYITTAVVIAGIVAVTMKFKDKLMPYADKIGIGEYLR